MRPALVFTLILWPLCASSAEYSCPGVDVTVENGNGYSARICETVERAMSDLEVCNLRVTRPLVVSISDDVGDNCVGMYHCGSDRMEILHPAQLAGQIDDSALFSQLEVLEYFDSIVFHELVHAAYDEVACPFQNCTATSEYLAYALQIRALSSDARDRIGLGEIAREKVRAEAFSAIFAFWAPDKFAVKAWTHLMQRPDPCGYVADLAAGDLFFDSETPHIIDPPE
ncbi:MAG: hypothetical protein EX266_14060 [Rhodobacteraceae bacterium]|nr:MAG: hypothetical protein EX266_14060 [Paracoccaceae bacterium]